MPLAPIKQSYKVVKPMKMLGALVFWRVEDAGVLPLKRIWRDCQAGYVRNLFNQSPPVYDTLDFIPRGTGQVFHDFRVGITNLTIVVSGNITQMAGFNPTMVRLLRNLVAVPFVVSLGFNPTMVRLLRYSG